MTIARSAIMLGAVASRRWMKVLLKPYAAVVGLALASQIGFAQLTDALTEVAPPRPIESTQFTSLDGARYDLGDHLGRATIVNYWATWCGPCVEELPLIEQTFNDLKAKGLQVVAINAFDDPDVVSEFLASLDSPVTFDVVLDPEQQSLQPWRVSVLPTTYVLDQEGMIVWQARGPRDFNAPKLRAKLEALLDP